MTFPIFVQFRHQSRYDLLDAMAMEIAEAFAAAGYPVNPPPEGVRGPGVGLVLWMNFLGSAADVPRLRAIAADRRLGLLQFFVDHPLALWAEQIDHLSRIEAYRMALPCADSAHLLRLRWPTLRYVQCLHGVSPRALAGAEAIERGHQGASEDDPAWRPDGVIVLGSIHTEAEIADIREAVPARFRKGADETAEALLRHPWTTFEQALDITMGCEGVMTGEWSFASLVWRYVTARVNRARRSALVSAMQGLPVVVHGPDSWKEFCVGTIVHRGPLPYASTPGALARAKVCLAWGPTQFTHSFSERLLLSMAAGCATVADDRLLVRRHFAGEGRAEMATLVSAAEPAAARAAAEALLADGSRRAAMGVAARAEIARAHLWVHRLDRLEAIATDAIGSAPPGSAPEPALARVG